MFCMNYRVGDCRPFKRQTLDIRAAVWLQVKVRDRGLWLYAASVCNDSDAEAAYTATGWPQKVSHYQMIKNRIISYYRMSMILDLLVILMYESSTIILIIGVIYSMRYLLSDLSNNASPAN